MTNTNYYVAVSGGVDSSVVAKIMAKSYDNVTLIHATCWHDDMNCTANDDLLFARKLSSSLDLPLTHLNLVKDYRTLVFNEFLKSLDLGFTPNPDILCNEFVKFGSLLGSVPVDAKLATGHYSNLVSSSVIKNYGILDSPLLITIPLDRKKDQTYYLCRLINRPDILSRICFPLSNMFKSEVRGYAKKNHLPSSDRKDSYGFCFIGDQDYRSFISKYIKNKPGNIVNESGDIIGMHSGLHLYTIGQRHGFNLNKYSSSPAYITEKRLAGNVLVVGNRIKCMKTIIKLADFISPFRKIESILNIPSGELFLRIRSLGEQIQIKNIEILGKNEIQVSLNYPVFAPAKGQYGVIYHKDAIIGSGVISDAE